MARAFLVFLLLIVAAWYAVDVLEENGPGYFYIYYNHYSIESSFWVGMGLIFAVIIGSALLLKATLELCRYIARLGLIPKVLAASRSKKLEQQGQLAFLVESWELASRKLSQSAKQSETAFIDYLMAAKAAIASDNVELAKNCLLRAKGLPDADELSIDLLELDITIRTKEPMEVRRHIKKLLQEWPDAMPVIERAIKYYQHKGDFYRVAELAPSLLNRKKPLTDYRWQLIESVYFSAMEYVSTHKDGKTLQGLWSAFSKADRNNVLLIGYAEALINLEDYDEARKLIQRTMKKAWCPKLASLYVRIPVIDANEQLAVLDKQLPDHQDSPELHLAIGIAALRAGLNGRAKEHLHKSIELEASIEAYQWLAKFYEQENDAQGVRQSLQRGLELAVLKAA